MPQTLFLAQLASTLFMTGLIWFVQIVHYPLFPSVGPRAFPRYEQLHAQRTGWVVFPPMLVELLTALAALLPRLRPAQLSCPEAITSAALVLLLWLSTALLQIPLHNTLQQTAFDGTQLPNGNSSAQSDPESHLQPTPISSAEPAPATSRNLQKTMHRLTLTNWIRTTTWTARSLLLLSCLHHTLAWPHTDRRPQRRAEIATQISQKPASHGGNASPVPLPLQKQPSPPRPPQIQRLA